MIRSYFSSFNKTVLVIELLLIYIGLPLIYALDIYRPIVIPVLVLLGLWSLTMLLNDRTFDRRSLWRGERLKHEYMQIVAIVTISFLFLSLLVWMISPAELFFLVQHKPVLWLILIVAYPILSVYPQELLFRALFFQRYQSLFSNPNALIFASAFLFAYAHIIFLHWIPVVLTFIGGLIFAWRYDRTRSMAVVFVEHSLFGLVMFTVGLGHYFYAGSIKTATMLVH